MRELNCFNIFFFHLYILFDRFDAKIYRKILCFVMVTRPNDYDCDDDDADDIITKKK